ncbi:MAG: UDP-N-acetylmuramoyl-L-alanine--D-glutamate ligase [Deltaproteobacteria bacterium]|nr:UDP-N-acetylmuramoyl-L-alanine--D-glutamate ligase [Deltaproteobacteria bacterium]
MMKLKGKKALVIGLGKTGQSSARFLAKQGARVIVTDSKPKSEFTDAIKGLADVKIDFEFGKHSPKYFTSVDFIVLSPGVPSDIDGLVEARAKKIPIINDIELAYPFIKAPIVAVTGTNGKTTTAALIAEMLRNDGKKVFLGGNIGTPVLNYLQSSEQADVVVLEVSSFQCESLDTFKPKIAVFTNLEPDHLDRYPAGVESYYTAKSRLLCNAGKDTVLVTNLENERAARLTQGFPGKIYSFTKQSPMSRSPALAERFQGAYLQKPKMVVKIKSEKNGGDKNGTDEEFNLMTCRLAGDHNRENLMAAACAAKAVGCSKESIQKTIENFRGVPHRLEYIRRKDGVYFYNDSKATNVASVIRALSAFTAPIILIAGGRDKDQDFSPLVDLVRQRVKHLILLGEAKEKINRIIGDFSETFLVGTFEEAVLLAYQKSRSGDVILLSPGCASYDMFKNYEERGDYFKKLVGQL